MSTILFPNAVGWGHFQLRGGLRNILLTAGAYGAAVGGLIYITVYFDPKQANSMLAMWMSWLLSLQLLNLFLFGSWTVSGSVRQDLTSGMLESHRLMPVPPLGAILGYIFGSSCQAIAIALVNLLLGAIVCTSIGKPVEEWIVPNVILGIDALFLWSMLLCLTFVSKAAFWLVLMPLVFSTISQGAPFMAMPGMLLLFSPMMNVSVFSLHLKFDDLVPGFATAAAVQMFIAGIFALGAIRRYRRPESTTLGIIPSLLLLAAWVASSMIAISAPQTYQPTLWRMMGGGPEQSVQMMGSMIAILILALIPIANSGKEQAQWRYHAELRDPALGRRPVPPVLVALTTAAIALCIVAAFSEPRLLDPRDAIIRTGIIFTAFVLGIGWLLRIFYRAGRTGRMYGAIFLAVTWMGPLLIDFITYLSENRQTDDVLGPISTASPIGALNQIWFNKLDTTIGIGFQCVLALAMGALFYGLEARRRRMPQAQIILPPPPMMTGAVPPPLRLTVPPPLPSKR